MADTASDHPAFDPAYGHAVIVAPGVRRLTARNPGPFTHAGTNSYVVGAGRVAIVDPGPDDPAHVAALLAATAGETVTHILLTHTHRDHSGAVTALKAATGAPTLSGGRHRSARPIAAGETNPLDDANDTAFIPDHTLADGEIVDGGTWRLAAIATPGHTANHVCFALLGGDLAFSGDHAMAWSTSIVAPPDGSMADYMASLDKLLARPERLLFPGHGPMVDDARGRLAALKRHRLMREAAILDRLAAGDRTIPDVVAAVYRDTDPGLHGAAALSVLAHLEDLVARGIVASDGSVRLDARYRRTAPDLTPR